MVNTRNNNLVLSTPPFTDPIQAALAAIHETLANNQAEVRVHSTEIASLKRGERTTYWIEIPKFSGDDVKDWVYMCKQFFKVDGVPDGRKIHLASMHMFDAALVWNQQYVKKYPDITLWEHFKEAFEALLNKVDLPELIAVSMFIRRLKPEVGTLMRMFQANNLSESYQLARMQEATNTILKPRNGVHKPYRLTQKELEDKRAKGQCFYCDQKFVPGHKCSGQLHSIEVIVDGDLDNYIDGDDETYEDCVGDMVGVTDSSQITLNALSGLNSYQTMRVRGRVGGCEMVLGIQWLATLGDIQCNFKKLFMKFNHKGRQLVLTGITNTHVHWMQGNKGMMKQAKLSFIALCVYPVQLCQMESIGSVSVEVEQVLTQFDKVFKIPKDLPPQRSHDHQIPLMPNTHSINDKFPIPVIKELINELNGSVVFSKLDLRSGYHQIRMKEYDIFKTDFRTYEGHYEFLVMPFGLTNAPSTFQSLMNTVFKAFLRKFVLVFFDDILIYSKNLEEHYDHVKYLGHIISAQGAMKMEHYLSHTEYQIWQVIQNGNGLVSVTTDTNGMLKVLPPKTAEEVVAREGERKPRTTLLMALLEDHLEKFHKMDDAKEMWEAIKSRFGGNDESKKIQKYLLKQQFKGFSVSASEGLHKGYDRFQTLLSQLEIHGAGVSHEDANQKFLRVFERNVKGTTTSLSSNTQNVAFVSADNTSRTNDVSTAYSVSSPSVSKSHKEGSSSYTDEINDYDIEEMDLKWQVAMISIRIKKFHKRTGRKLQFDTKDPVGFDKTKVECFNCHKMRHFARDCRDKGNQDSRRRNDGYNENKARDNGRRPAYQDDSKALVSINGEDIDWSGHVEEDT
nr:hypothetical protein [Tanacetum cinerariifolium]